METKIGKLENVEKIGFLFKDLEIIVDGQKFYNRIICEKMPRNMKDLIGKKIVIEYKEMTTMFTDWIFDIILFNIGHFKPPRHYNQILKIEVDNSY